jgi:hypothetical protein
VGRWLPQVGPLLCGKGGRQVSGIHGRLDCPEPCLFSSRAHPPFARSLRSPHTPLPPPLTAEPSRGLFSSLPSATEPPKKKRSAVLDGILEQLEDEDNSDGEQALQL